MNDMCTKLLLYFLSRTSSFFFKILEFYLLQLFAKTSFHKVVPPSAHSNNMISIFYKWMRLNYIEIYKTTNISFRDFDMYHFKLSIEIFWASHCLWSREDQFQSPQREHFVAPWVKNIGEHYYDQDKITLVFHNNFFATTLWWSSMVTMTLIHKWKKDKYLQQSYQNSNHLYQNLKQLWSTPVCHSPTTFAIDVHCMQKNTPCILYR